MQEPTSCDYIYIDENNGVHLLVPIVGGNGIGTDNTCQMKTELGVFLEGKPAKPAMLSKYPPYEMLPAVPAKPAIKGILESYAKALMADIKELEKFTDGTNLKRLKQERLEQINGYIEIVSFIKNTGINKYSWFDDMTNHCKTNGVAIRLSPSREDNCLSLSLPIFSFARSADCRVSSFRAHLIRAFGSLTNAKKDVREKVLNDVVKQTPEDLKEAALLEHIQTLLPTILADHGKGLVDLSITNDALSFNYEYLSDTLFVADEKTTPRAMAEMVLKSCTSDDYWLDDSPFSGRQTTEQASIKTQFFIAQACAYAHAYGFSDKSNAGTRIENNSALQTLFSKAVIKAYKEGVSVEVALLDVMNANHKALGLNKAFTPAQREELVKLFSTNFNIISGHPHFDEFLLFFATAPGMMANHLNRLSLHLVDALSDQMIARFSHNNRSIYQKHKVNWLAKRHQDFQKIQNKKLEFSNEKHLGNLPEIENPEPLAPLIEQLARLDVQSFHGKNSINEIRQYFTQINSEIDEIAKGRVIRAEQSALSKACLRKRDEIQAIRDKAIAQLEEAILLAEKARINSKIENQEVFFIDCQDRFERISEISEIADVQSQLLALVPTDEEIELFKDTEKNALIRATEEMKIIIFSLASKRKEELDPILRLQRQIQAFDISTLLLCDETMVELIKQELLAQLANFEVQAERLGALGLMEELKSISQEIERSIEGRQYSFEKPKLTAEEEQWLQAKINALNEVQFEPDVADTNDNLSEQEINQLFDEKLAVANDALDTMLSLAQSQMPDMDLSYLEDEISCKKIMYVSAVEERKKILIKHARLKAETAQLATAIRGISLSTIQQADSATKFLNAKSDLLNNLKNMEACIESFPPEQQLELDDLLNKKRVEIQSAINSIGSDGIIADEMKIIEQRYSAVFAVMNSQQQKINAQSTSWRYGFFNNNSSLKANTIKTEIENIALKCYANSDGDLKEIKNTYEFKIALLNAWDDKNSALYKALNSKRISYFGHSLTLFSGQSWSQCVDGDSATVKAIKEIDPARQVEYIAPTL